jgi:hypothetical protein
VEFFPTKKVIEEVVMKFLEENIITRFGFLANITTDNVESFITMVLNEFVSSMGLFYHTPKITILKEMGWNNPTTKTL